MHPTPVGSGKGGLFRRLALPFSLFVLGASLSLVAWLQGMNRDRSLREFEETARENARFVERLRLPRSPELARNLSEVLGVGVGFFRAGEAVAGLPSELVPVVPRLAEEEPRSTRSGRWDLAIAPVAGEPVHLVLLRETAPLAPDPATWLLPSLIVTALGGGLAALVARRIVLPLGALTRWLPNLDRDSPDPLPATVTARHDEIGTLARSLEESHRRLREETERRRQSERLAALGRIATSLAHEIRNPAAAIRLHADLLSNEAGPESKESIDLIRDEVDRITDLVNQWLFVARGAPPRTTPHDLVALTRRVLARLAPQFDHARVTATLSGADSATVNADGPRLEQVVRNLLLNAMQAMPEGGTIRVAITTDDKEALLEITDQGRGFSEEALQRWSEPFFSEREGGMGLGLTLADEVMQGHSGSIGVANDPDGGARVSCRIGLTPTEAS